MRLIAILLAFSCLSAASPPHGLDQPQPRPHPFSSVAVPCLRPKDDRRYVVTWEIRNTVTGERRSVGSQEVRLRC